MRSIMTGVAEPAADLLPEWHHSASREDEALTPQLRTVTLLVVAPLGWLIWAGLILGAKSLLFQ